MRHQQHSSSLPPLAILTLSLVAILPFTAGAQQELITQRPTLPSKAVALDWRKVPWPALNYDRLPIEGGGGLYVVRSNETLKFSLNLIFPEGVYSMDKSSRPTLGAYADLLLEGGTSKRPFEAIQQYTQENGISLATSIAGNGAVTIALSGLSQDFDQALNLLGEVLASPAFRDEAFATWKRDKVADFERLLDAKSLGEQLRLVEPSLTRVLLGPDHYFAMFLDRNKPATVAAIKLEDVRALHDRVICRRNLLAMAAGRLTTQQVKAVSALLNKLPAGRPETGTLRWLPGRGSLPPSDKAVVTIVRKADMPQSSVVGRVLMMDAGELNPLEEAELAIAKNVFSSTSGVVGEDRFSGALRKRSGLSYSASARFDVEATDPNTNVATWTMYFQTPMDKTADGIDLAWKTWQEFRTKGISEDEFASTRIVLMNKMLTSENPVLQKATGLLADLADGKVPATTSDESTLARLEAVSSAAAVNTLLGRLTDPKRTRVAFALIGGVSDRAIKAIRKLPFVDKVEIVEFKDLRNGLQ